MECKYKFSELQQKRQKVLIETLWNVNTHESTAFMVLVSVLIETLWNVNFDFERDEIINEQY